MGGMVFDEELGRGIRKKNLPTPRIIEFARSCNYEEVIREAKDTFFPENSDSLANYVLADSGGAPFVIKEPDDFILSEFLKDHNLQPSKLRLYIMHYPEVSTIV